MLVERPQSVRSELVQNPPQTTVGFTGAWHGHVAGQCMFSESNYESDSEASYDDYGNFAVKKLVEVFPDLALIIAEFLLRPWAAQEEMEYFSVYQNSVNCPIMFAAVIARKPYVSPCCLCMADFFGRSFFLSGASTFGSNLFSVQMSFCEATARVFRRYVALAE